MATERLAGLPGGGRLRTALGGSDVRRRLSAPDGWNGPLRAAERLMRQRQRLSAVRVVSFVIPRAQFDQEPKVTGSTPIGWFGPDRSMRQATIGPALPSRGQTIWLGRGLGYGMPEI